MAVIRGEACEPIRAIDLSRILVRLGGLPAQRRQGLADAPKAVLEL